MMEAAFKKNVPNLAYYLAAMSSTAGSAGYPSWPSSSPHIVPTRPKAASWSMPPGVTPYEYNHNTFNSASVNNTGRSSSFEDKDGESVGVCNSITPVMVQNASQQWMLLQLSFLTEVYNQQRFDFRLLVHKTCSYFCSMFYLEVLFLYIYLMFVNVFFLIQFVANLDSVLNTLFFVCF